MQTAFQHIILYTTEQDLYAYLTGVNLDDAGNKNADEDKNEAEYAAEIFKPW